MADFAHLHVHTLFSLLEGAIRLDPLLERVREGGMDSVAITDTGNLFGAVTFYKKARAAGIKPILGSEVTVTTGHPERPQAHLVLLAKDTTGYRNLSYLLSKAHLEGGGVVDSALLASHAEGLFALSACVEGEVAQHVRAGEMDAARESAARWKRIFAPGHYHLELQKNAHPDQGRVNDALKELSRDLKIPLVATCDCHYLDRRDARAHEVLMAIKHQVGVDELRRMRPFGDTQYLRSEAEMLELFEDVPDAVYRAAEIAEACQVELELGKVYLPAYEVPEGYDQPGWLREAARRGLERRLEEIGDAYAVDREAYTERLEHELDVIVEMGFSGYFLIVQDFINWAKANGVPVGPGRGSGAGSLVAYALRITDLDPIHHGLLFERFLNPERVSMPDFDVDFCQTRRDRVIRYVTQKYGAEQVGQIITFGQLKARSVIRDVVRVMGLPYAEGDRIAKLVPDVLGITLEQAIEMEPRLKELKEDQENPIYGEILEIALKLEGLNRQAGMHAAGIVIGDKPLWEYVPLYRGNDGEIVTQFAKDEVEEAGLVKFDFLGLKTLTVIDHALSLVNRDRPASERVDIHAIPLDDPEVYRLIARADTTGVFQLESSGFKELLKKLKPDRFSDIVAAVALYRPGPLQSGMVDDYIARKHGRQKVTYPHPALEKTLEETYGVIVYQEQVMEIARLLAGYSLGAADILRRAMGKKKADVMAKERARFLEGAKARGVDPAKAGEIFDLMEKFAAYGFNKSHSAAYGLITYQTAWLKTHHPVEFMCALLSSEKDNTDKVVAHIGEIRREMGIEVLPPDINESVREFDVAPPARPGGQRRIRFGLGAVKGVGESAVEAILEAREAGPFRGLFDFCERVDLRRVTKKTIEVLIKAGCFDFVGVPRWQLVASIDRAVDRAQKAQRDRAMGQSDLFGGLSGGRGDAGDETERPELYAAPGQTVDPWTERELLTHEKQALGFYVSGHPLDRYVAELERLATPLEQVRDLGNFQEVRVGGVVTALRERPLRSGSGRMAFVTLEDLSGTLEAICFSSVYAECEALLKSDEPLLLTAKTRLEGDDEEQVMRLNIQKVERLADVRAQEASAVTITVAPDALTAERAEQLRALLGAHPGTCRAYLRVVDEGRWETLVRIGNGSGVAPSDDLLSGVDRIFGRRVTAVR
ncbi:MAG: DNA polymerase III subunit alpha [Deltaproteobacteria bacterium]|nr:MAG: DNA polymerase III subunit alpha [Deltaproteobacteria bacterium]